MERRAFLTGAATTLVTITGCVAQLGSEGDSNFDTEFSVYQPGSEGYRDAPNVTKPPVVEFNSSSATVNISGKFFVGSSTCGRAVVKDISYDSGSDTLTVKIGSGVKEDAGNACSGDESADAYRLRIEFDDSLPSTVSVTEGENRDSQSTTAHR